MAVLKSGTLGPSILQYEVTSLINLVNGMTSLHAVNSAMYAVSIVLVAISVWRLLNHPTGQAFTIMRKPVRDLTQCGS